MLLNVIVAFSFPFLFLLLLSLFLFSPNICPLLITYVAFLFLGLKHKYYWHTIFSPKMEILICQYKVVTICLWKAWIHLLSLWNRELSEKYKCFPRTFETIELCANKLLLLNTIFNVSKMCYLTFIISHLQPYNCLQIAGVWLEYLKTYDRVQRYDYS